MRKLALLLLGLLLSAGALAIPASASAQTYIGNHEPGCCAYAAHKPNELRVDGPTKSNADSIHLRRVHWSSWGRDAARATTRWRYKTYDPYQRVRIRAFRPRRCVVPASPATNNRTLRYRLYSRVTVTGDGWHHTWKAPGCRQIVNT